MLPRAFSLVMTSGIDVAVGLGDEDKLFPPTGDLFEVVHLNGVLVMN